MSCYTTQGFQIKGISASVPKRVVENTAYEMIPEEKRRMLIKTIGVERKRHAERGVTTGDLCEHAARRLLTDLNWNTDEIGVLVLVTQSSDYYLPSTSIIIQNQLGLSKSTIAFDVNLGCSGYVYGLSIVSSLLQQTGQKKGILLAGDISTLTCSYSDKSTYPLFGDAGTATAIELSGSDKIHFNHYSDGNGHKSIYIPDGGARNQINPHDSFKEEYYDEGITRTRLNLALSGLDVFNFSIREVPPSVRNLLAHAQIAVDKIDYFVMHQANKLMNETIRKKLGFEKEQVPYSLTNYGNTSSASIPLTISTQLADEVTGTSRKMLLSGFGVGLSWSCALLSINLAKRPTISEYEK